jgi:hypothetical protein
VCHGSDSSRTDTDSTSTWDDPATSDTNIAWTRAFYEAMRPHSPGGSYLNFPGFGEEGEELVKRSYGSNYAQDLVDVNLRFYRAQLRDVTELRVADLRK